MQLPVKNLQGEVVDQIEVADGLFDVPMRPAVVHQAVVRQANNARAGTHSTKTRDEVAGGGKKPWPQKHTGRARASSIRSPIWVGGGIVWGPRPRSYRDRMPKKMRRLALRCLLSDKQANDRLVVVKDLALADPKTKTMAGVLHALGISTKVLIVTEKPNEHVIRSSKNLKGVKTLPGHVLNVQDLLKHDKLLMTVDAVRLAEQIWAPAAKQTEVA